MSDFFELFYFLHVLDQGAVNGCARFKPDFGFDPGRCATPGSGKCVAQNPKGVLRVRNPSGGMGASAPIKRQNPKGHPHLRVYNPTLHLSGTLPKQQLRNSHDREPFIKQVAGGHSQNKIRTRTSHKVAT